MAMAHHHGGENWSPACRWRWASGRSLWQQPRLREQLFLSRCVGGIWFLSSAYFYFASAVFFVSAITALKAGFGWSSASNNSGRPFARHETPSFTPQKVTTFTELRCLRKARKSVAY